MTPASLPTPESSGTSTPTSTTAASSLTAAGIKHQQPATNGHGDSSLSPLDASRMTFTQCTTPREVPEPNSPEVMAQKTCTDHMVTARWTSTSGWEAPELKPYGPFSIMPTASVLHYATECFEGLKLYRGHDGKLRLFRPSRNCERMRRSCARIALPDFDAKELEKMIIALCARDGAKWLPASSAEGSFLYIRPTMISTDPALGVQRPKEALLYVILACFPDMSRSLATPAPPALAGAANGNGHSETKKEIQGLKLLASNEDSIRAWPGGFGYAKLGANYGPSLVAQGEARARGFDQVLWLFGEDCNVTEAGASNFFVVWRNKSTSKLELVTAPLTERIILEGVTRASILDLARERLTKAQGSLESVEVVERKFTMHDLLEAADEGRLVEAFAAGTAFFVAPVELIHFRGREVEVPVQGETGDYAKMLKSWLSNIMYGKEAHEWGVEVEEVEA
ncbi:hypothetical protein B0A48_14866 [Cryoendolithus antarcticus]|uniref:Branched-chain-amino-acid aminotransferase n=1 Tax=Cryoendolithus antarcticus TaxID=1507870 RepID=A0A1V8SIN8_9PEZI|nr:hypothetical protein B0A48_14866 [Cryoendolithus antarcticus]